VAELYLGLDLFVFASRFDTFGNVILEALVHGMPAVAFNCKGPKDILEDGRSGYLVDSTEEMTERIISHFRHPERHESMRRSALARAAQYEAEPIMHRFMQDLGLGDALRSPARHTLVEADADLGCAEVLAREKSVA